jgi:hypothetical protein
MVFHYGSAVVHTLKTVMAANFPNINMDMA